MKYSILSKVIFNLLAVWCLLVVGVSAVEPPEDSLRDCGNGIKIFKNVSSYFEWVDSQKLPRVLIVGSFRGKNYFQDDYLDKILYGEKKYNYFLIDVNPNVFPDLVCSISDDVNALGLQSWDYVCFEYVPIDSGACAGGARNALDLLRNHGNITMRPYPQPDDITVFNYLSPLYVQKVAPLFYDIRRYYKSKLGYDAHGVITHKLLYKKYFREAYLQTCFGLSSSQCWADVIQLAEEQDSNLFPSQFPYSGCIDVLVLTKK